MTDITVTGRMVNSAGQPVTSSFLLTPSAERVNTATGEVIPARPVKVTPGTDGNFSQVIRASDDPALDPVITYTYRELWVGGRTVEGLEILSNSPGGTIELAAILNGTSPPAPASQYVLLSVYNAGIAGLQASINAADTSIVNLQTDLDTLTSAVAGKMDNPLSKRLALIYGETGGTPTQFQYQPGGLLFGANGSDTLEWYDVAGLLGLIGVLPVTSGGTGFSNKSSLVTVTFPADGYQVFDAPYGMTIAAPVETNPSSATVVYERAASGTPTVFTTATFPLALNTGDKLRVTVSGIAVGSYFTSRMLRTA